MQTSHDETALRADFTLRAQRLSERMALWVTLMQDNLRLNQTKPTEFPLDDLLIMAERLDKLNREMDGMVQVENARRATRRRTAAAEMMQLRRAAARLAA